MKRLARDLDHRRVDLEEGPALARLRVAGQGAAAEADHADPRPGCRGTARRRWRARGRRRSGAHNKRSARVSRPGSRFWMPCRVVPWVSDPGGGRRTARADLVDAEIGAGADALDELVCELVPAAIAQHQGGQRRGEGDRAGRGRRARSARSRMLPTIAQLRVAAAEPHRCRRRRRGAKAASGKADAQQHAHAAFGQGTSGDLRHQQGGGEDQQRMLIGPVEQRTARRSRRRARRACRRTTWRGRSG